MKLVINYDLIDRIWQAQHKFGVAKIMKNNWKNITGWTIGGTVVASLYSIPTLSELSAMLLLSWSAFSMRSILLDGLDYCVSGDKYQQNASNSLKRLVAQLNDLNISTNYELLLQSEHYGTQYSFDMKEKGIFGIIQEKYIMVPTYNYNNEIKNMSMVQEHEIGTKEYILTPGSPRKAHQLSYSASY